MRVYAGLHDESNVRDLEDLAYQLDSLLEDFNALIDLVRDYSSSFEKYAKSDEDVKKLASKCKSLKILSTDAGYKKLLDAYKLLKHFRDTSVSFAIESASENEDEILV